MIESLLRVADAVKQLATERAGATVDPALKIDDVRHDQFCRGARRWRAQVSDEIADGKIDFVTHRRNDWHCGMENCARNNFFVEFPQIFDAPAAARDHDQ